MKLIHIIFALIMTLIIQGCGLGLLAGSGFSVMNKLQTGEVELQVLANGTRLEIANQPNRACAFAKKEEWKKGCYFVDKGDISTVGYVFKVRPDAEKYYFKTFRICPWSYSEQQNEVKPTLPCTLGNASRMDFWVEEGTQLAIPDGNGVLTLPQPAVKLDSFTLHNNNVVELDYFYWVEVCPRDEDSADPCLWTDPGSGNGGRR